MSCDIVSQPFPPANVVFTGIGVLLSVRSSVFLLSAFNAETLQAAKGVWESHDVLVDLFERIKFFLNSDFTDQDMVEILVRIMAEVLSILSIATRVMQQSRTSKLVCNLYTYLLTDHCQI